MHRVGVVASIVCAGGVAHADPSDPPPKLPTQPAAPLASPVTIAPMSAQLRDDIARSNVLPITNTPTAPVTPVTDWTDRKEWIFEGIGGAAIVAGGVLLWYSRKHAEQVPPVGIVVTSNAAFASWTGHW